MVLSLVMPVSALDGQVQAERREGYDVAAIHYTDGEGNERAIPFTDTAKADDAKVIEAFFSGTLDGQGHRIINLYYVTADGDKIDAPAALTLTWASGTGTPEEVAATCTETGLTAGVRCTDCGKVISGCETIPALGHDYKDGKCSRCGAEEPTTPVEPGKPGEPFQPTQPEKPTTHNTPATGDSSNVTALWVVLAVAGVGIIVLVVLLVTKHKNKKD